MYFKRFMSIYELKNKPVFVHTIIGVATGYFLLHPITMVIYWFEMNIKSNLTFSSILEALGERFMHTFYMPMMPMSIAFAIIGGLLGLVSGKHFKKMRDQQQKIKSQRYQLQESIQSLIRNGESEKVEFKSAFRHDFKKNQINKALEDVVVKTIAGFMNASGGILIIGVNDEGHLLGLTYDYNSLVRQNRDGFEQKLMQVMADKLGTDLCPFVHVGFHQISESEICTVYIEKSHRPVYIHEGGNTIFYLRTGNITKPLNTMETVEFLKAKGQLKRNKNQ